MTHYPNYIASAHKWSADNAPGGQEKAAYDAYCSAAASQICTDTDIVLAVFDEKKLRQLKRMLLGDSGKPTLKDIVENIHKDIRKALIDGNNL